MRNKTTKQIEKEIAKLRRERQMIEDSEYRKIQRPFLLSQLGKCFVYIGNSYGGNSGKWNVYKKVLKTIEKGDSFYFVCEEFSTDCYGKSSLIVDSHIAYTNKEWYRKTPFSGYEPIDSKIYEEQKTLFLEEMNEYDKCIQYIKSKATSTPLPH